MFARGDAPDSGNLLLHVLDEQGWTDLLATLGDTWTLGGAAASLARTSSTTDSIHARLLERVTDGEISLAYLPPRGIGPTAWSGSARDRAQILRRFMLLGQTLEGMRVWDIRRATGALRRSSHFGRNAIVLQGERDQAVNALYASLGRTSPRSK